MSYEKQNLLLLCCLFLKESAREEILVKTVRATNEKVNPVYFHDINASKGDFDSTDRLKLEAGSPHQNKRLASDSETVLPVDSCLDTETPKVSIQKTVDIAALKPVSDNGINSTDILHSPTSERRTCECNKSIEKSKDRKWAFFFLIKVKKYIKCLYVGNRIYFQVELA